MRGTTKSKGIEQLLYNLNRSRFTLPLGVLSFPFNTLTHLKLLRVSESCYVLKGEPGSWPNFSGKRWRKWFRTSLHLAGLSVLKTSAIKSALSYREINLLWLKLKVALKFAVLALAPQLKLKLHC
mmetsp:Transcript_4148/g.8366  ORF Transcript_4148/g.8366 Transcript_4148/m.8366 type:complete len:125 (+) Transcript_4148:535-909(+)